MNVLQLPNNGNWEYADSVALHSDGIDVGGIDLISVSNTPVYDSIPNKVETLVLREFGKMLTLSDSIRITLSKGASYDEKKGLQITNASLSNITSNEIILTGYTKSDVIVHDIPVIISDTEEMDVHFTIDVSGFGYKQNSIASENIFHTGLMDTLYYARDLPSHVIPASVLKLTRKLSSGDT